METATLTVKSSNEQMVAQTAMIRAMLNILEDKIRNKEIRQRTKIRDGGNSLTIQQQQQIDTTNFTKDTL